MAMGDYGAILKVNGKFINKNFDDFYMEETDMGYKPKNKTVGGFVIAGDENFLLTFYKGSCYIYHNKQEINYIFWSPFIKETVYNENLPNITIEHLDKNKYPDWDTESWSEFLSFYINKVLIDEEEIKLSKIKYSKYYKRYLRYLKTVRRYNKNNKFYTSRWKATWNYKENNYEVIFGMGIDNNEEVWNRIKYEAYDFTDYERKVIDGWFKGDRDEDNITE